jgi:hypothetical protein
MCWSKLAKNKDAVAAQRAADGESELMLPICGLDVQERIAGVKRTVAQIIKSGAVKFV